MRKNESIGYSLSAFYCGFVPRTCRTNNKFGKWHNPITKTEFTLSIFSSAFYKQGNKQWISIVSRLAVKGEKRKTIRDVCSDVTHQDGDSSVCSSFWKLLNGGTLADGYTISSWSLNVAYKDYCRLGDTTARLAGIHLLSDPIFTQRPSGFIGAVHY